jgi:type II secretory pathway component PulF
MSKRGTTPLAGVSLACCLSLFSGIVYLVYVVPRKEAAWAEAARELTAFEQSTVQLSNFCKQSGAVILPLILLLTIGCIAWLIIGLRKTQ